MKTIIVTVMIVFSSLAFAQRGEMKRERLSPEERVEKQLQKMTSELNLSDEQQEKIKPLLEKQSKKREQKREEIKEARAKQEKKYREDRSKMKDEMEKNQAEMKQSLAKILTPDQLETWENHQKERKGKIKEHRKERNNKK